MFKQPNSRNQYTPSRASKLRDTPWGLESERHADQTPQIWKIKFSTQKDKRIIDKLCLNIV